MKNWTKRVVLQVDDQVFYSFVGFRALIVSIFFVTLLAAVSVRAEITDPCPTVKPSLGYLFRGVDPNRLAYVNSGVIAPGFVHPPERPAILDGIEVSKYQSDVDFVQAKACGASFALIRLTAGTDAANERTYKEHWRNAKSVGLLVAPYHNLSFLPRAGLSYASLSPDMRARVLPDLVSLARNSHAQSELFLGVFKTLIEGDPIEQLGRYQGKIYLDPVLDMTYDPLMRASEATRLSYGRVVRALACSFVNQIKSDRRFRFPRVILYVTPAIWRGYRLNESTCGLGNDGIILSFMTRDGGSADATGAFADICLVGSINRCIFDHYTTLASFLDFNEDKAVSLLRFYGTTNQIQERLNALP